MVNFTSGLDGKLWKEEQKKKISAAKNRLRSRKEQLKWKRDASKWGHKHPKRGMR